MNKKREGSLLLLQKNINTSNRAWIALIPAYEPEQIMIDLLKEINAAGLKAIVVDDGSGSDYKNVFDSASQYAKVLSYPKNHGKGHALKTGLDYIHSNFQGDYIVVTIDADGQHTVKDALKICEAAEKKRDTLILGSRMLKEDTPLRSRFGNTVTHFVYDISTGINIRDTQTGLRAFSAKLLPTIMNIPGERYEYEMNVLLEFSRMGIPIEEIAISTIYIGDNSCSHFNTLKDSCRIYKEILKFSASSFISFLIDYGTYSLLLAVTAGLGSISLPLSNVCARIVSASANYTINRKMVFKSDSNVVHTTLQYFILASIILTGNTILLKVLVNNIGMNRYGAKLITEIIFFTLSWLIQRFIIFKKKKHNN